jgi:hypothetical protein
MWATGKLGEKFQTSAARKRKQNLYSQKILPPKRKLFKLRLRKGARPRQSSILLVSQERHMSSYKRLSHLRRVQKENDPKAKVAAKPIHSQRS